MIEEECDTSLCLCVPLFKVVQGTFRLGSSVRVDFAPGKPPGELLNFLAVFIWPRQQSGEGCGPSHCSDVGLSLTWMFTSCLPRRQRPAAESFWKCDRCIRIWVSGAFPGISGAHHPLGAPFRPARPLRLAPLLVLGPDSIPETPAQPFCMPAPPLRHLCVQVCRNPQCVYDRCGQCSTCQAGRVHTFHRCSLPRTPLFPHALSASVSHLHCGMPFVSVLGEVWNTPLFSGSTGAYETLERERARAKDAGWRVRS